ncbi:hypothetical protein JCM33374_g5851 [Metschnikowia sp. JCM 33374]|nr:hypothetical protein JCM33374_g5851 [Metschnikowia sp. JCM 33374]
MVTSTSVVTSTSESKSNKPESGKLRAVRDQGEVLSDLIKIIESEYNRGNRTVTHEKYTALLRLRDLQRNQTKPSKLIGAPLLPAPLYPSIFHKFKLPSKNNTKEKPSRSPTRRGSWTFKQVETTLITVLEAFANILDNLHLLSKMPLFPKSVVHLLNHTNRIWVLILVFLIRKTISQLLNVRRKETKIANELAILKSNTNSKLLEQGPQGEENNIFRKYEKVLKDLKFDKTMLNIELMGNLLDLAFNMIELYDVHVPRWLMSILNFASMGMTIYRMNKDVEYNDDDISEDLI